MGDYNHLCVKNGQQYYKRWEEGIGYRITTLHVKPYSVI